MKNTKLIINTVYREISYNEPRDAVVYIKIVHILPEYLEKISGYLTASDTAIGVTVEKNFDGKYYRTPDMKVFLYDSDIGAGKDSKFLVDLNTDEATIEKMVTPQSPEDLKKEHDEFMSSL